MHLGPEDPRGFDGYLFICGGDTGRLEANRVKAGSKTPAYNPCQEKVKTDEYPPLWKVKTHLHADGRMNLRPFVTTGNPARRAAWGGFMTGKIKALPQPSAREKPSLSVPSTSSTKEDGSHSIPYNGIQSRSVETLHFRGHTDQMRVPQLKGRLDPTAGVYIILGNKKGITC